MLPCDKSVSVPGTMVSRYRIQPNERLGLRELGMSKSARAQLLVEEVAELKCRDAHGRLVKIGLVARHSGVKRTFKCSFSYLIENCDRDKDIIRLRIRLTILNKSRLDLSCMYVLST
jgi:hypothetical protein